MSLKSLDTASHDQVLIARVAACVQQEAFENPAVLTSEFREMVIKNPGDGGRMVWPVAIATEAEYASALANGNPDPGGDESVISDSMILSAVQTNWPPDPVAGL